MPADARPEIKVQRFDAPEVDVRDVPRCAVCGREDRRPVAWGYDYELQTCSNRWRVVACKHCRFRWLDPRPAPGALEVIYPPGYYAYNYDEVVPRLARRGKALLDRRKLNGILAADGGRAGTPSSYLDVGCGNGRFLRAMASRGVPRGSVFGIELDARVVSGLRRDGFRVFDRRVEDVDGIRPASIELATMFHVIEHVADPGAVLARVRGWLKPGGRLAVETPNFESLDARLFGRTHWGGYHFPRHWHFFSPSSLCRLLERLGFEVVSLRFQTGHSFWMYSLHHYLRYARGWRRLAGVFDPLSSTALLAGWTAFDQVRAAAGRKTSAMLVVARPAQGAGSPADRPGRRF